jgi:hypothetical protein
MKSIHSLNEKQRRNIVIDYIRNNQGSNKQRVVSGLSNRIGRVKVFHIIDDLVKDEMVREERANENSRDIKLFIDTENPLVLVPKELDDFERIFFSLFETSLKKYTSLSTSKRSKTSVTSSSQPENSHYNLMLYPLHIFYDIVNLYNIRTSTLWPSQIRDKGALKNLYLDLFTKISEMQIRISGLINALKPNMTKPMNILLKCIFLDKLLEVDKWTTYTFKMMKYYELFSNFGMESQIEAVLNFIWKVSYSDRDYLYSDNRMKEWNYKYEDGWKRLHELIRIHLNNSTV